jgi:signal transduction histidine kinase
MALKEVPEHLAQKSFLPGRTVLVGLYLYDLANLGRMLAWYAEGPEYAQMLPWMLGAMLSFLSLWSLYFWRPARTLLGRSLYFGFQALFVLAMFLLQPRMDFLTGQYLLLGYQIGREFSGRARWSWIAVLLLLAGFPALISSNPVRELSLQLTTMAGIMVMAAYVAAHQEEQAAREQNQLILVELRLTHQQLQAYAGQVEELATLEERSRLAREIHDSVSQTLFSLQLHARAARLISQTDSDRLGAQLQVLLTLSQSALADMRAFLVQLHSKSE